MIIIDASVAVEIVLATRIGGVLKDQLRDSDSALGAPEIIELEILQTMRRLRRMDLIDNARADQALLNIESLVIRRFPHQPLAPRIWALRNNLTAYDAAYFALAELLDAPLWTRDVKFSSVPGHDAQIVLI